MMQEVNKVVIDKVIHDRKPLGQFYYKDKRCNRYVGVANESGDAFTEDFKTYAELLNYMEGNEAVKEAIEYVISTLEAEKNDQVKDGRYNKTIEQLDIVIGFLNKSIDDFFSEDWEGYRGYNE
jgi:hypothetical protein